MILRLLLLAALALPAQSSAVREKRWVVEQMPGGSVKARGNDLEIEDEAGCTVWWTAKLRAPCVIRYEVTLVAAGGPHDRVSDANCFFLATDPRVPDGRPFAPGHGRTGKFEDYDSLRTYYVGMGGNTNTTTRFRRYAGDGTKPLLPGHDLQEKKHLLQANRAYRIEIRVGADGTVEYRRDGELFFSWRDPDPLREGWFGIRTVKSHQLIRSFSVANE
ncbi:MAG TPA: DUF6250 domain-containing protein [Opitutaceae bacterium]|nr:DUF6250 domain-containing protein [Opitutaceae bacterium]